MTIRKMGMVQLFGLTARHTMAALLAGTSALALASAAHAIDINATPYTPGNANYNGKTITIGSDTVNLSGASTWTGSTGTDVRLINLTNAYNAGYITGGIDPNGQFTMVLGTQNTGVAVFDPITQSYTTVNTYSTSNFLQVGAGGSGWDPSIYFPSAAGAGPFVESQIANVTGGGTLNLSLTGLIGNGSVKNTVYVDVKDGTANWNSLNSIAFAASNSATTPASLQPYNKNAVFAAYNGTFTVTTSAGTTSHDVTDLTSFKSYNDWLIGELQAGRLGSGAAAQTAYNAALAKAYTNTTYTYNINPQGAPIPSDDPMLVPVGTQVGMRADGNNATGHISVGGGMAGSGLTSGILLNAQNGGTIINDGTVSNWQNMRGIVGSTGGHIINNGVRNLGYATGSGFGKAVEAGSDSVSGTGTTYINNGTVNLYAYQYSVAGGANNTWLGVGTGAVATNHGAVNVGTATQAGNGNPRGVSANSGGTFINETDGLIYLGREASALTTGDVMARGGADVAQPNGAYGIIGNVGSTANNKGTIIIGDLVQGGYGMVTVGTGVVSLINSGTIEVRGHYSATPITNLGMTSTNTSASAIVNNAGTINLTGINVIGMRVTAGGKAQSSGVINVIGGADPVSGLRNYGIWSDGSGSKLDLSGTINLAGDGAIGVHARNSGGVAISGNGQVVFQSGTNQIGYFVYGTGAAITNTGTGAQNVSTENSVLFRMEDGASFTGGAGASSILTASGKGSTAVVVTGVTGTNVSAFNSGGMTINTTGENAVAVLVEGGAQGKITSAATINLTGLGAIAGIADGQKHALDGSTSGAPIAGVLANGTLNAGAAGFGTGTLLVAGANLNSSLDQVTGYIARNGASLSNSGNILFTGKHTTGIQVLEGSTGGNSGAITIQDGSIGLTASSTGAVTTLNNSGNITLKGGSNADRTLGISANGSAVTVNMSAGTIALQGQGAIGAAAYQGATVNLTGTASAQFASDPLVTDQILLLVSGAGSTVNTATSGGGSLDASGTNSTLIRLENGATQSGVLNMGASGNGARGIWATGAGTKVTALSGSTFNVGGNNAEAVLVQGAAEVNLKAGTIVNLTGTNTVVGTVDGNEYALDGTTVIASKTGSKLVSEATLNSTTAGATGFITQNAGNLINSGNITFSGANSAAIKVINGNFTNQSGNVTANGVALDITGASSTVDVQGGLVKASDGIAAIRIGQDASLNLVGSGVGVVTASGTAHAVLVDTGAKGLVIDGAHIDMASSGVGTGNGIENKAEIAGLQLTNTTVIDVMDGTGIRTAATLAQTNAGTINVKGSGTGIAFETATGTAMSNNIDMSGSAGLTINVSGANGTGILVNHSGSGIVNHAVNVNVTNAAGGSALVLTGVTSATNNGQLISSSTTSPVVALGTTNSFSNTGFGKISSASGTALSFDGQNSQLFNAGQIIGLVAMNGGNNFVTNTGTITGNVTAANGNNTVTNAGVIVGNIALGSGTNVVTLNDGSTVINVSGTSGTNNITVKGNAAFTLLDGGIGGGNDTLTFDGATHMLSATSSIDHFETMRLVNGSTVTTADLIKMTDTAGGVGAIAIDATSKLAITTPTGYTLNHAMTGTGVISAQMAAGTDAFSFGAGAGNAFTGTLQMGTGTFALSGVNTTALTKATLRVDTGSVTTVGTGNQAIGGLTFNGGTMVFDASVPAQTVATSYITADKLDISGTGTVKVTVPTGFNNSQPLPNTLLPLLQQDDATAMTKLVGSANVTGTGGALTLVDQNGVAITNAKTLDINQNSVKVAEGTYDYRMLSSSDGTTQDGLYVGYGLTQVNLIGTGVNALVLTPATGATGLAADLSAKVIGSGDLAIAAGTGQIVTLSNALNSYSGITDVQTGTLKMAAHNVLGVTSSLNLAANAAFDTNGYNQAVGELNTGIGAKANIAAGSTLTITDLQRVSGTSGGLIEAATLTGAGALVIDPSTVSVNGAQAGFSGQITVEGGSQLKLNTASAFDAAGIALASATDKLTFGDLSTTNAAWTAIPNGTAAVALSGLGVVETRDAADVTLTADNNTFAGKFDIATGTALRAIEAKNLGTASILANGTFNAIATNDWEMENLVTGAGIVLKTGTGLLKVSDGTLRNFTGLTDIQAGTLQIGAYANDDAAIGGAVRIAAGARMGGTGVVHGDVENTGTITALNALSAYGSNGEVSGLAILGTLTNSGTVQLGGATVGNTLTVNALNGQGGTFVLNTVLGSDNSATDKIIVNGGAVTGSSFLAIVNQGGLGAQTTGNGIAVVEAQNGATTQTGSFTLASRVAAGAYEYNLARGDQSGSGDSWYLRTPEPDPINPAPAPTHGLRPEIPTNAAIAPLASEFGYAMLGTLHERTGGAFVNADPAYEERKVYCKDAAQNFRCVVRVPVQQGNDSQRFVTAGWARIFADRGEKSSKNFTRSGSDYDYTLGGAQIGLDIYAREQADGTLDKAGIYVGYGQVSANIRGVTGGKAGSVDLDATSVGAYWTHYAASGWYTDAVIQGTWYSADARSVKGEQIKPDGFGFMASLEGGYSFKLGSGWVIEPQAQLIYQNISFDQTNDSFGTFRFQNSDSLRGRLGVRVARNWNMGDEAKPRLITAWLRANVWHEFKGDYKTTVATLNGTSPYQTNTALGGTWGEIGAGVNAQVSDSISLFATGAYQHSLDNKGRQGWNGRLGINVKW